MKLTAAELSGILAILEKIDRGLAKPQVPGRVGRFLRQYQHAQDQIDTILKSCNVERRADAALSGNSLGTIGLYPLFRPEVSVLEFPLGEVAQTLAISESIGGLIDVVMWLKGVAANSAYNVLGDHAGVRLSGDYRWTPLARITTGEAFVEPGYGKIGWSDARCLKAVADDLSRPPHAMEYVLDYRIGRPGIKYFRSICAKKRNDQWVVLPAFGGTQPLEISETLPEVATLLKRVDLAILLAYREPWSNAWTIVRGFAITPEEVFAHCVIWADFQREVLGEAEIDARIAAGIRESLSASGLTSAERSMPQPSRELLPVARSVLAWLRGSS